MKPSRAVAINPWSKLHPPLPRTPRQSQQLLDALTSSFRRELDREHPPTVSSSEQSSSNNNGLAGNHPTENHTYSAAHAADQHLRTILDNPLFRLAPSKVSVVTERSSNTEKTKVPKEPMVIFDELVASGSATFGAVTDCLSWQMLLASRYTGERFLKELRDSRAGSRTVSWWFSLDTRERTMFFRYQRLLSRLCKFMVAEKLHDTIFVWLRVLRDWIVDADTYSLAEGRAARLKYFLGAFLNAERECGGIDSAIRYYLDACSILMPADNHEYKVLLRRALGKGGGFLFSDYILVNGRESIKNIIPADLYEKYATTIASLMPGKALLAALSIYHPTHPDAKPLLQYLRGVSPERFESWSKVQREKVMRASFDALHVLIEAENPGDCLYLARFLQQKLDGGRGADPTTSSFQVSSEEKALLTSLDLTLA
ncbi:hypothetical protein BJX76DRAFT_165046 [Aspergillus varians]